MQRTIIVTGCNKGIGYGIVEGLCKRKHVPTIIMACRNKDRANTAKSKLEAAYPAVKGKLTVAILDIRKTKSCDNFATGIATNFVQVDCLVNNAGIAINCEKNNEMDARRTAQVNYFGTAYLSRRMLPLIADNGKIITVTSKSGKLTRLSLNLQQKFLAEDTNELKINLLGEAFFLSYRTGDTKALGYKNSMYGMSKVMINCWIKWWAQTEDVLKRGIQVYALCPGYVRTDMAKGGVRTITEGAKTPLYLIDLPYQLDNDKQGKFFFDQKPVSLV